MNIRTEMFILFFFVINDIKLIKKRVTILIDNSALEKKIEIINIDKPQYKGDL
jgi:hypothetical protein